jgi:hypothetical protein
MGKDQEQTQQALSYANTNIYNVQTNAWRVKTFYTHHACCTDTISTVTFLCPALSMLFKGPCSRYQFPLLSLFNDGWKLHYHQVITLSEPNKIRSLGHMTSEKFTPIMQIVLSYDFFLNQVNTITTTGNTARWARGNSTKTWEVLITQQYDEKLFIL